MVWRDWLVEEGEVEDEPGAESDDLDWACFAKGGQAARSGLGRGGGLDFSGTGETTMSKSKERNIRRPLTCTGDNVQWSGW